MHLRSPARTITVSPPKQTKLTLLTKKPSFNNSIADTKASIKAAKSGGKREANAIAKLERLENTESYYS